MAMFRNHILLTRLMALVTGLMFLNMSFFLIEVRVLDLKFANEKLTENISKLLSGTGCEEEPDMNGDSKEDLSGTEVDIFCNSFSFIDKNTSIQLKAALAEGDKKNLRPGPDDRTTPPPERSSSISIS
jgi:hypothetical protein